MFQYDAREPPHNSTTAQQRITAKLDGLSVAEAVHVRCSGRRRAVSLDARVRGRPEHPSCVLFFACVAPTPAYSVLDVLPYDANPLDHPGVCLGDAGERVALKAFRRVGHLLPIYVWGRMFMAGSVQNGLLTIPMLFLSAVGTVLIWFFSALSPVGINQPPVAVGQSGLGHLQQQYSLLAGGFLASLLRGDADQPFGHPQRLADRPRFAIRSSGSQHPGKVHQIRP